VVSVPVLVALGCASKRAIPQPVQTGRSSLDRLRKNIRKYVEDKHDRERALAKVDRLRDMLVELDEMAFMWRLRSHEAGPDDECALLVIADEINARMREHIVRAAALMYSFREDIPAGIWTRVFPAPKESQS
jgi:hypothetical protein